MDCWSKSVDAADAKKTEGASISALRIHRPPLLLLYRGTRMWAEAQRDGRPAEYRWRFLFNAAKFAWRPLPECRAIKLQRRETHWN